MTVNILDYQKMEMTKFHFYFFKEVSDYDALILLSFDAQIRQVHATDMSVTWILHTKIEVSDTIRHDTLTTLKYSGIIAFEMLCSSYHILFITGIFMSPYVCHIQAVQ